MATSLVSQPVEPTEPNSVVRWNRWATAANPDGYTFASIRTPNGLWFTTQDPDRYGRQVIEPMYWEGLLLEIDERNWHTLELLT